LHDFHLSLKRIVGLKRIAPKRVGQLIDHSKLESWFAELEERQLLVERSSGSSVSEIGQLLQKTALCLT
jgi:hypothetical protein